MMTWPSQFGDYVFFNASLNGISPLAGVNQVVANQGVTINYAQGCELWSNDQSGFADAVSAAEKSDVVVIMVGTWCACSVSVSRAICIIIDLSLLQ